MRCVPPHSHTEPRYSGWGDCAVLLCCVRKDNTEEDDDDKDSDGDNINDTNNLSDYYFCTLLDDTGSFRCDGFWGEGGG